jgi:hypothetical protein
MMDVIGFMVFLDFVELVIYWLNFDIFLRGLQLILDLGYRSIIMQSEYQTTLDLIADHTNQNDFHFIQLYFLSLGSSLLIFG